MEHPAAPGQPDRSATTPAVQFDVKSELRHLYELGYQHGADGKARMWHSGSYSEGYAAGLRYRRRWVRTEDR
jgi:hypothetical protein